MAKKNYSVDYSKWDKIVDSDDEKDKGDEHDDEHMLRPRVTKLDAPGRVTFGGSQQQQDGDAISITASTSTMENGATISTSLPDARASQLQRETIKPSSSTTLGPGTKSSESTSSEKQVVPSIPASWTDKGARVPLSNDTSDAAASATSTDTTTAAATTLLHGSFYYWSQDRLSVHVRVPIVEPTATATARSDKKVHYKVTVSNILPYSERYQAVMSSSGQTQRLCIEQVIQGSSEEKAAQSVVVLQGELPYPVHLPEEDDTVDWSIEQYDFYNAGTGTDTDPASTPQTPTLQTPLRYVLVSLFKATPVPAMTLWWKKLLLEHKTEIELSWVERNTQFQQAWDEAHAQFKETIKEGRTKYTV